jgi:hypothetical protein
MKPKIKILFTVFLCSISSVLIAQSVDINMATAVAKHHMAAFSKPSLKSTTNRKNFQFTSVKATVENNDTLYYILNDTINKGFVIVSADKRAWPILAYSTEGSLNEKKQPDAFAAWMENRKQEIELIRKNNLKPDEKTSEYWNQLILKSATLETTSVEPLLKTKWDQGCFYNELCPSDSRSTYCGRVPTGCVATAMAQIMKYWNFPTSGTGSHSYLHPIYGNLSADFGTTTYQWSQMPNELTSSNDAVAKLMHHCGVSLDTEYGPISSGAYVSTDPLVKYFNYSSNARLIRKKYYKTNDWLYILKSELDLHHPIWYQGASNECMTFGHAFVCDGYQNNVYFHFNWGWGGVSDGYFYLESLNPNGMDLNSGQAAIINLFPSSLPNGYDGFFISSKTLGIGTIGGTVSENIVSSVNWKASSNQSWLSLSSVTGIPGASTITLTANENNTGSDRSASVVISAVGFTDQLITVKQPTKVKMTQGNLHNMYANNPNQTTHLTLTGTIDARDFRFIRDSMTMVSVLDLSDVKIVEYTGKEGTIGTDSFTYPANTIPSEAFYMNCSELTTVTIPHSANSIGKDAFTNCFRLSKITIPSSVTSIGELAFCNCWGLSNIVIPPSVTSIGARAFTGCNALIDVDADNSIYSSVDGVLFNKTQTKLLHFPVSKGGDYIVPSSVTTIGTYSFTCNRLINITIPLSVTTIEDQSFSESLGLLSILIPSSVTFIGNQAFKTTSALLNVDVDNPNYSSNNGVLFNKLQTRLIQCPVSKTVYYRIPSSVISIGEQSFWGCNRLTSITIPSSVNSIESNAFVDCRGLDSLYLYSISPVDLSCSMEVFVNINKEKSILYVPYGSKATYQSATQWKDFKNIVEILGFRLSATTANVKANQGSTCSIDIYSNVACSVTSNQSWLKASLSATTGTSSITFEATENPEKVYRSAIVTVSAEGVESQTITITQEAKNTTGIDQISITPEFMAYPNPTTGKVKLAFDKVPINGISITVNDINGKSCLKQVICENEVWIDLNGNVPGIYFIKTDQDNLKAQKIILK